MPVPALGVSRSPQESWEGQSDQKRRLPDGFPHLTSLQFKTTLSCLFLLFSDPFSIFSSISPLFTHTLKVTYSS